MRPSRAPEEGPAMSQVVQAKCPHCLQTLRIPSEWIGQAMRCKFCKSTFQARTRTPDTPLPANAVAAAPVARAAPAVAQPVAAETAITASPAGMQIPGIILPKQAVGQPADQSGVGKNEQSEEDQPAASGARSPGQRREQRD